MLTAIQHGARGGEQGPRFIFPFLFLLLIGFLVAKIIRRKRGGGHYRQGGSPLQTLDDRFARGDIDRDEYMHRKAVLDGDDVIPPAPPRSSPPAPSGGATATVVPEAPDTTRPDVDPADDVDEE